MNCFKIGGFIKIQVTKLTKGSKSTNDLNKIRFGSFVNT